MELHTIPTHSRRVTVHAPPAENPLFAPFLLAVLVAPATSTELQPGMIYESGQAVNVSALGLTLTLPPDHRGTLPHGSEWFVIESGSGSRMLVYADRVSEQDMIQALSAPIALPGAMLMPSGAPRKEGRRVIADFGVQAVGAAPSTARAVGRAEHGSAVVVVALGTGPADTALQAAASMHSHIVLAAPAAPAPAPAPPAGTQPPDKPGSWSEYMRGRYVARYYTRSQYTDETHLWLCSDGSFSRSASAGGYSPSGYSPSGAYQGNNGGSWSASGALPGSGQLLLRYGDGSTGTHVLELRDSKLYLDGVQWLRDSNNRCP